MEDFVQNNKSFQSTEVIGPVPKPTHWLLKHRGWEVELSGGTYIFESVRDATKWFPKSECFQGSSQTLETDTKQQSHIIVRPWHKWILGN